MQETLRKAFRDKCELVEEITPENNLVREAKEMIKKGIREDFVKLALDFRCFLEDRGWRVLREGKDNKNLNKYLMEHISGIGCTVAIINNNLKISIS